MSAIVQQALEETIQNRNEEIDDMKGRISVARDALRNAIVFINNKCRSIDGQEELLSHLNKSHKETRG